MDTRYELQHTEADKLLQPDGSIVTRSGALVAGADVARAAIYNRHSPKADKLLQPDGTVLTRSQINGGSVVSGGSGGADLTVYTTSGNGSNYTATIPGFTGGDEDVGKEYYFLPHANSQNSPTLNVNNTAYRYILVLNAFSASNPTITIGATSSTLEAGAWKTTPAGGNPSTPTVPTKMRYIKLGANYFWLLVDMLNVKPLVNSLIATALEGLAG